MRATLPNPELTLLPGLSPIVRVPTASPIQDCSCPLTQ